MINVQLLDLRDQNAAQEVLQGQKSFFGVPIEDFPFDIAGQNASIQFVNKYLRNSNSFFRAYGAFEGNVLQGLMCADFMADQPMWILRRICVDENVKGNGRLIMNGLMRAALEHAEVHGYFQHLYLIPDKYKRAHSRIWEGHDMREHRYVAVELEHVQANKTPRFRRHWEDLYGRVTFPIDTSVRMSVLLDEFR